MWVARNFEHKPLSVYNIDYNKKLGEGAGGTVYAGKYQGQLLAIKVFGIHPNLLMFDRNLRELIILSREVTPYLNYLVDYNIDFKTGKIAYVFVRAEDFVKY